MFVYLCSGVPCRRRTDSPRARRRPSRTARRNHLSSRQRHFAIWLRDKPRGVGVASGTRSNSNLLLAIFVLTTGKADEQVKIQIQATCMIQIHLSHCSTATPGASWTASASTTVSVMPFTSSGIASSSIDRLRSPRRATRAPSLDETILLSLHITL